MSHSGVPFVSAVRNLEQWPEAGFLAVAASLHCTSTLGTSVEAGVGGDQEGNTEPDVSTCKAWLLGPGQSHRDCDRDIGLPMAPLT